MGDSTFPGAETLPGVLSWKRQLWVIPPAQNAAFVCAMARVLDVYQRPCDPARPLVCPDESPNQLLRESRVPLTLPDGSTRYDCEDHRQGVVQVYSIGCTSRWLAAAAGRSRTATTD